MIEWKQRLRAEFYELDTRWQKLKEFLRTGYPEIEEHDLLLLHRQEQVMGELHSILHQRLNRAGWGMSLRLPWMNGTHHCDWVEDFEHENGNYYCQCVNCNADFIGHKRRVLCRECHNYHKIQDAD